jgi:protein-S-isoprenylcysteine O-methyltransferase Ste14
MIVGFVLILHKPMGWLFLAVITVLQIVRAHREARVLEAAFGEAYREYRSKTWF